MNIPKIDLNTKYLQGCQKLRQEQAKTTRLIRRYMRLTKVYNPFYVNKDTDNILKRYEKSFWG